MSCLFVNIRFSCKNQGINMPKPAAIVAWESGQGNIIEVRDRIVPFVSCASS
jgi:hypothetical protein